MKKLRIKLSDSQVRDCIIIRDILNKRGFDASIDSIAWAYAQWCEHYYSAGWINLIPEEIERDMTFIMQVMEELKE